MLAELGLARAQARHLLTSGLAGPATRRSGVVLYESARVHELVTRTFVDDEVLARACPQGMYVARLARGTSDDVSLSWEVRARRLATQPAMAPIGRALLAARIAARGPLAWVATISGLVVFGAEATALSIDDAGRNAFALDAPGPWFDALEGRWLPTGRGRHWVIWEPVRRHAPTLQE